MRQAVESVSPQPESPDPVGGKGVGRCGRRQTGVERGVEARDGWNIRHEGMRRPDAVQGPGLVQRRQAGQVLDAGDDRVVDDSGPGEPVPPEYSITWSDLLFRLHFLTRCWLADLVPLKITYLLMRWTLGLAVRIFRREQAKNAELLVLRHENAVLRRNAGRVRYESAGLAWFAALTRFIPRRRWPEVFPVTPATLLAWHRRLAARKYDTSSRRQPGRPATVRSIRPAHRPLSEGEYAVGVPACSW